MGIPTYFRYLFEQFGNEILRFSIGNVDHLYFDFNSIIYNVYYKNIEEDVAYLEAELPVAEIDVDYKYTMIRNLVTLAKKDEIKEVLLGIQMTGAEKKL